MNSRNFNLYSLLGALFASLFFAACTREFLPPNKDENPYGDFSDSELDEQELIARAEKCLENLEFDIAQEYLEKVKAGDKKENLKKRIDETRRFTERYLLYYISDRGFKTYVRDKDREKLFKESKFIYVYAKTNLQFIEEKQSSYKSLLPTDISGLFNLDCYPGVEIFSFDVGNTEFLKLGAFSKLNYLYLLHAKKFISLDLRELRYLKKIKLKDFSSFKLLLDEQTKLEEFILDSCVLKNLDFVDLSEVESLNFSSVFFKEKFTFKTKMNNLKSLGIESFLKNEKESESSPIIFDSEFLSSLNENTPLLEKIWFNFMEQGVADKFEPSLIKLPNLKSLSVAFDCTESKLRGEDENKDGPTDWSLKQCPNLRGISISNAYTNEIDFSKMSISSNPELASINISGLAHKVQIPDVPNLIVDLDLMQLREIKIPKNARLTLSLSLSSLNFLEFDASSLNLQKLFSEVGSLTVNNLFILPSNIKNLSEKLRINFIKKPILDFSDVQWIDFSGKISIHNSNISGERLEYIDFGYLKADNFENRQVYLPKSCVIKNRPDSLLILNPF